MLFIASQKPKHTVALEGESPAKVAEDQGVLGVWNNYAQNASTNRTYAD